MVVYVARMGGIAVYRSSKSAWYIYIYAYIYTYIYICICANLCTREKTSVRAMNAYIWCGSHMHVQKTKPEAAYFVAFRAVFSRHAPTPPHDIW